MKKLLILILCALFVGCTPKESPEAIQPTITLPETVPTTKAEPSVAIPTTQPPAALLEPEEDALVFVTDYIPGILVELKYATTDNFTGQVIYDFTEAQLRYGTVKKLAAAQEFFEAHGLSLKIWDAYRPVSAQWKLWEAYPDGNFVANPNRTHSSHSRGNTIDVTLVDKTGRELEMPTAFDDFTALADRDYSDCSLVTAENARLLQSILEQHGFRGYQKEWWHFTDTDSYEVINP